MFTLGILLFALSGALLWLPLSRPSVGLWVARRSFVSECLALAVVSGMALGAAFLISATTGR